MSNGSLVMVVEDDLEMNALERELLSIHGLSSVPAYNGLEAVDLCQRCDAVAVLLDIMLPGMDGFETCRRLRRSDGTRPYILIVTALDSEDFRSRGYEMGADAYFVKPFDPDALIETLQALIVGAGGNFGANGSETRPGGHIANGKGSPPVNGQSPSNGA